MARREPELDLELYPKAPRKWFGNGEYGGKRLPARLIGALEDGSLCYKPCGNSMSSWVRVETPGKRARFIYDAGGSFRPFAPVVDLPRGPVDPQSVAWFEHCKRVKGAYKVGERVYRRGFGEEHGAPIARIETKESGHATLYLMLRSVDGNIREYAYHDVDVVYETGQASSIAA